MSLLKKLNLWACALALSLILSGLKASQVAASNSDLQTSTPIHHFLVVLQQNHTFDNYFGTYPGANGFPVGACMPSNFPEEFRTCVKPFHIDNNRAVVDLTHNNNIFLADFNNGLMNGFVRSLNYANSDGKLAMGYYDQNDLGYYWNLAHEYVLFDNYFTSAHSGSVPNRMFWVAGVPGIESPVETNFIPPQGFNNIVTIFDRLQQRGISWKFYVGDYQPDLNYRSLKNLTALPPQVQWVPLLSMDRFIDDPTLSSHIVDLQQYYTDLANGTLPAVSYFVILGASEHPDTNIQLGQKTMRNMIQSLMQSDAWTSSAFMISYDDFGGWYDHVRPPQVDQYGYGFRAPALLISPYARAGYIDHAQLDHTSDLKFIEDNWGIQPLAERDYKANDFLSAFDFSNAPRSPFYAHLEYGTALPTKEPNRTVIYEVYGLAVIFAMLMLAGSAILRPHRQVGALTTPKKGTLE